MKKAALIGILLISAVLIAGCTSNNTNTGANNRTQVTPGQGLPALTPGDFDVAQPTPENNTVGETPQV